MCLHLITWRRQVTDSVYSTLFRPLNLDTYMLHRAAFYEGSRTCFPIILYPIIVSLQFVYALPRCLLRIRVARK